ncbi:MAG: hypothetical protein AB8F94_29795 [Saprospiraceae bacterium]
MKTREASQSFNRNVSYWEENEEWFSLAADREFSKLATYAIGNPIFRNKMVWYSIVLRRLESALRKYQTEAKTLIEEIQENLNKKKN